MNTSFLIAVQKAPKNFYSPCGNSSLLTINEIETRATNFMIPSVTFKEMVFRKFNEIKHFSNEKNIIERLKDTYQFLEERGLSEQEADEITYILEEEITKHQSNKVRVLHNPF